MTIQELSAEALLRRCPVETFDFETTESLEVVSNIIGQDRAVDAIQFGTTMRSAGYNVFALGPHGVGKFTSAMQFVAGKATHEPTPSDWCYVYNFETPHRPRALQLPPGYGNRLAQAMRKLVEELTAVIPAIFEGDEYARQRTALEEGIKARQEEALEALKTEAEAHDIGLISTPNGMAFAPLHKGQVMSPEEFHRLSRLEQEQFEKVVEDLKNRLQAIMQQVPHWHREFQSLLKELNAGHAAAGVAPLFEELAEQFAETPAALTYLQAVRSDIISSYDDFLESDKPNPLAAILGEAARPDDVARRPTRYRVNVMVDHSATHGAPVVHEDLPTYQNLIGRVEHVAQMGALLTDFSLIQPGALHRANGGYLVLDAWHLFQQPYAWEGLKRALRAEAIKIESLGQIYSAISTVSLEPEPIPLAVKVVMMGEPWLYYWLAQYDPDFMELFKVSADFETSMPRDAAGQRQYAQLIASLAHKEQLRHFDRSAVARLIEHSSRLAGDAEKLTAHMQSVADVLREANYWAERAGRAVVTAIDVQQAIDAQTQRLSRMRERLQESILRQTILIDTDGAKAGQINGLSVWQLGNFAFGLPSRITARVRSGKGEVIDIERQVDLGGPIHAKGVLILSSFLASRYAAERPFALSATLVFEQSYGGVEGDSASTAELCVLLSALADAPIRQSLAVTGSVNQHGVVQAIGGVNEKIEGFFDICQARGLTGEQGVLIPASNVKHLMLRGDVVAAVRAGQFHVYPLMTVDEALELLTGLPAGVADAEGIYPADSLNGRVMARLATFAERQKEFSRPAPARETA